MMVYHDAALSFLHFTFLLILVAALGAEAFLLRLPVDARLAKLLLRADAFYGISAIGLLGAGAARAIWGAKGWEYYAGQPFFWAKLATFALVGVISIWPTLTFLKWNKAAGADAAFMAAEATVARMRRVIMAELHLLAVVVLFAALMARGIGS